MPEYDFTGQVAFVTGAAHGQGESHAIDYAKHGADVVCLDIGENKETIPYDLGTADELEATAEKVREHGSEALTVEADVSKEAEVQAAVEEAIDHFGHVDILANNAGIESIAEATELDEAMWDELVDTNLKGVWLCAKHVGQHFIERGDGGKIVNTTSVSGMTGLPIGNAHYVATKWGVRGLTKTLALELAEYDVNVNAVAPTGVDTPMLSGMIEAYGEEVLDEGGAALGGPYNIFEPGEMVDAQDITEAYMWLSSDAARYVTGITLPVDAGFTAK
ncbi:MULTISPECIES: mycofactocin-coupled SDR family oxidoreductase [Halolamina]|uniref:SDR family mycofactocin-dependent oxidoreductase n=1 Tax=Halolamina pelagica TaxID=699431 RepID=A0A1I5T4I6_9EURY|nr:MULTISPECIES: mycofactocin-coupled SDR family oxidoreductase [Halolamina]NHX37474.1 mycofactocin-coupled SDR family oxidoreductase [Halolamina sp. R1-12]SFP77915.1 SDR family mycofactocin-dependent oxidoreductase [Halolamina pelagica]